MGSAEGLDCPALGFPAGDQRSDADDGMINVLWGFISHHLANFSIFLVVERICSGKSFKVGDRLDVPYNDMVAHDLDPPVGYSFSSTITISMTSSETCAAK